MTKCFVIFIITLVFSKIVTCFELEDRQKKLDNYYQIIRQIEQGYHMSLPSEDLVALDSKILTQQPGEDYLQKQLAMIKNLRQSAWNLRYIGQPSSLEKQQLVFHIEVSKFMSYSFDVRNLFLNHL